MHFQSYKNAPLQGETQSSLLLRRQCQQDGGHHSPKAKKRSCKLAVVKYKRASKWSFPMTVFWSIISLSLTDYQCVNRLKSMSPPWLWIRVSLTHDPARPCRPYGGFGLVLRKTAILVQRGNPSRVPQLTCIWMSGASGLGKLTRQPLL